MFSETSSDDQQATPSGQDSDFEQRMAGLSLSSDTRRFLHKLHLAEKKLNDAFDTAHQGGDREECVSQVYRDLYRAD